MEGPGKWSAPGPALAVCIIQAPSQGCTLSPKLSALDDVFLCAVKSSRFALCSLLLDVVEVF